MGWFNYYGLIILAVIMAPNCIYAIRNKEGFENTCRNRFLLWTEQAGRYGCIVFMIFNIPYTCFGFWFSHALAVYLGVNGGLLVLYLIFWAICWKKGGYLRAISLSVIPALVFLFSGITLANIPLIAFALAFAAGHIALSVRNAAESKKIL